MSKKNKAKLVPPKVAVVSGELAIKLLASLEALAEYDTYETEYDGQMVTMCHSCSSLETGDHHTGCDFIKAKKLIAKAYARAAIEASQEGDAKDAPNEAAAKALYETWQGMTGYVPWQDGGNSFMQDQARRAAIASQKGLK